MSAVANHAAPNGAAPNRAAPNRAVENYDVAIVGSGIVGLGHALAASRRGLRVIVFDRSAEINGASIRNFGHLCFTAQAGLARELALASREVWLRLARDSGIWLRESGTFVVARHLDELQVLNDLAAARTERTLGERAEVELLSAAEAEARVPVAFGSTVGGAFLPYDMQANPREAAAALVGYLAGRGVEFQYRTAVTRVRTGRIETTRGGFDVGTVIVAVNHDIDQLYPEVAERGGIRRCGLDMLRVDAQLRMPLAAPLLTGWSLPRYGAFGVTPAASAPRDRLHREHPELAALDLNQMYTQLPDGTLIVGDTHYRGEAITPFQDEAGFDALLRITAELFGIARPRVLERWQGVYASATNDFLIDEPEPGVRLVAATTGIGMTCGLGLAERVSAAVFDSAEFSTDTSFRSTPSHTRKADHDHF
ncbi:TIGR03364 family FAD-dependent oxidoreductase [Glaciibacter psychrotolerans]|uniref:FAD dependent oxidoreductase TIGR03364 n=1 Tax=Glaciibacter psychrotolerans TaxID=670054 RepID=A0A7Z0EGW5_9MICO|nr:TIGR03364 family FAD-dependent oxidoreductase [Leifsonia psychrotolerans]NYJ21283.1 FAD dependent oxidoreductase TIGR03364 [Leifsonia psychrotolerans]